MRSLLLVLGTAGVMAASHAHAEPYPQIDVDRPLLLLPDMTRIELGLDLPTYRYGASSHTNLGDQKDLYAVAEHAFGPVEVGVRFRDNYAGPLVYATADTMVGPGALVLSIGTRIANKRYVRSQELEDLAYDVKRIVVPHVFSLGADAFISAEQYTSSSGLQSGHPVAIGGDVGGTVQLVDELSATASIGIGVPVLDTADAHASLAGGVTLSYTVDRFDFYGSLGASNLQDSPLPAAGIGIAARFGS